MNTTKMSNEVQKEKRWIGRMKLRRKGGRWRRSGECVKQVRVPHRESEERWRTSFGDAFVEEERITATEVEEEAESWRRRHRCG